MFGVVKKLLLAREISFEEGQIKLLGQSITMTPTIMFIKLLKEMKKIRPDDYGDFIYSIAKEVGYTYSKAIKDKYGMDPQKQAEWDLNTLGLSGWGKGELIKFDVEKKKAIVRVTNSPVVKELRPSKEPVDFIIAGYIGGSGAAAFKDKTIECKEVQCQAMGNPVCMFEVGKNIRKSI